MEIIIEQTVNLIVVVFALKMIVSKNPVHSILFFILILVCLSVSLIIWFENEFLGLILLIVYAGAISVLFLFVVMMLNIRLIELSTGVIGALPLGLLFSFLFLIEILVLFFWNIPYYDVIVFADYLTNSLNGETLVFNNHLNNYYFLDTINCLGFLFYNYYYSQTVLVCVVLLIAMLGSILLTFNETLKVKNQNIFKQIEKTTSDNVKYNNICII